MDSTAEEHLTLLGEAVDALHEAGSVAMAHHIIERVLKDA